MAKLKLLGVESGRMVGQKFVRGNPSHSRTPAQAQHRRERSVQRFKGRLEKWLDQGAPARRPRFTKTEHLLETLPKKRKRGTARRNSGLIESIRFGDRVTIKTPQGQKATGRAVMRSSHGGWVLNMGGKHGTPGIADSSNVVQVRHGKRAEDSLAMRRLVGNPARYAVVIEDGEREKIVAIKPTESAADRVAMYRNASSAKGFAFIRKLRPDEEVVIGEWRDRKSRNKRKNAPKRPMTKREAERKAKQVGKANGRPFKVVQVIYSNGERGWDVTPK